ncbi:energy transducer TonB [Alishewanella sp. d11]|uniref:energy transducer TonB n=1 Tax=Alishewanella sp. d11 TaxID=3414030 RepID=UPI003BF798E3
MKSRTAAISLLLASLSLLTGCQTTAKSTSSFSQVDGLLANDQWQALDRSRTLYPMIAARDGKEGCATLSYDISPSYQISNVQVVNASSKHFAREAKLAIAKWQLNVLPAGLLSESVSTQSRFEFCLENQEGRCSIEQLAARPQCTGSDIVPVVGYRVIKQRGSRTLTP